MLLDSVGRFELDITSHALVDLIYDSPVILPVLRRLIEQEFWSVSSITTFLRANSITSKMLSYYLRLCGQKYLHRSLFPVLFLIVSDKELDLNVDTPFAITFIFTHPHFNYF